VISEACVELVRGRSSYGTCVGSGSGRILVDLVPPCRSAPAVLGGVVPAAADRVSVVLGNGRRLRGPTYTLPARFGARAFALAVPTGQAIRSVTADGEQGEVVATEKVRREPVRADCPFGGSGSTLSDDIGAIGRQRPAGAPQVAATDGDHRLLVADQRGGSGMCIGIDLLPERFPCGPVTPDPQLATVFRQGGAVAAILGSEVAYVDLRLTDGTTRRVPTVPGERYTGRYAGQVRFLVAAVPRVREAILRDAAGHELTRDLVYVADEPQVVGRGRLAGLGVTALRQPGIFDAVARSQLCVRLEGVSLGGLELLGDPILCEHRRSTAPVVALAPCGRPRSALVGVIPRSARGLRVQLADGRTVRPLLAKLGGALLWIARPPRRGRVIAVRYRHHRVPLRLPPRARQCGYVGVGPLSG
jgi:hypothetical protein